MYADMQPPMQARDEIARDEAETAARIAFEVKAEFEREAAERAAAKHALVAYLAGNEENKKLRAAAAEKQRLEDLDYMRQYEEILDKQQKERLARLEKLQEWQVRRASGDATLQQWQAFFFQFDVNLCRGEGSRIGFPNFVLSWCCLGKGCAVVALSCKRQTGTPYVTGMDMKSCHPLLPPATHILWRG